MKSHLPAYPESQAIALLIHQFIDWWYEGGDRRTAAVLLVCPARVERARLTPLWGMAQSAVKKHARMDWEDYAGTRSWLILQTLAGIQPGPADKFLSATIPTLLPVTFLIETFNGIRDEERPAVLEQAIAALKPIFTGYSAS